MLGIYGLKIVSRGYLGRIRLISDLWRDGLIKIIRFKINLRRKVAYRGLYCIWALSSIGLH